jgi:predicted dehydrogenase
MIERILIVGLGSIGKRHLRIARELKPNADIRILRHQECLDIPESSNGCFSNIEEALAFKPQLAIIANPATFHMSIAQPLAEIGTHLLIEKPLSTTTDGIERLIKTCHKNKISLLIGYNLRFLPSLRMYRKILNENKIGKVLSVRCEVGQYLPSWRPNANYKDNVSARKELGGGVLFELSHEVDYLRWIFGEINWVKASLSKQSNLDVDVEDTAHLILGFDRLTHADNNLIGTLNIDFIRHDKLRLCTAIGETGSLRWNGVAGTIELYDEKALEWLVMHEYEQQQDETYILEWEDLFDSIYNQKPPLVSGVDGLIVLNIINAARSSSNNYDQVMVTSKNVLGVNTV